MKKEETYYVLHALRGMQSSVGGIKRHFSKLQLPFPHSLIYLSGYLKTVIKVVEKAVEGYK
jgi:hypothetical protein